MLKHKLDSQTFRCVYWSYEALCLIESISAFTLKPEVQP